MNTPFGWFGGSDELSVLVNHVFGENQYMFWNMGTFPNKVSLSLYNFSGSLVSTISHFWIVDKITEYILVT